MSNIEELSQLTLNELKELSLLVYEAVKILNDGRKKLSELNLEGREIALTLELLSSTLTAAEMRFNEMSFNNNNNNN